MSKEDMMDETANNTQLVTMETESETFHLVPDQDTQFVTADADTETHYVTMTTSMGYYQNLLALIDDANAVDLPVIMSQDKEDSGASEGSVHHNNCLNVVAAGNTIEGEGGRTSAVDVETLDYKQDHAALTADDTISTIWEMRYLDHAAIVGRFMAEDLAISHTELPHADGEDLADSDKAKNIKRESKSPPNPKSGQKDNPEYRCVFHTCQLKFTSRHQRLYHYVRVHKEIQLQCPECGKIFVTKQQLETHIRSHFNIKPFTCDAKDCKKSFLTAQHLKNHKLIHTGDKMFECNICSQKFRERNSLNRHIRSHTKVKSYKCDVCQKSFSHSSSRNVHRKHFHSNVRELTEKPKDKKNKTN